VERFVEIGVSNAVMAAVLAVVAVLASLACRRPALGHSLWLLVLLKLVTPPLVPIRLPMSRPAESPEVSPRTEQPLAEETSAEAAPDNEEAAGSGVVPAELVAEEEPLVAVETVGDFAVAPAGSRANWLSWLAGLWLLGSALWFSLAVRRVWCFARILRCARPASTALQNRVARLAERIGLSRCPKVLMLPGRVAPLVWGLGRPRLLVPEGLLGRLGERELDTLLLHELAHIRRRDHLVRWLEFLALGLFWWNPIAWYARRELREAEEQCCDAWVVGTLRGAGRAYATALLNVLDFLCAAPADLPPLASGLGKIADLKRRLTMIMRGATPPGLGRSWGLTVAGLALLLLPVVPGFGQTQERVREAIVVAADPAAKSEGAEADLKKIQADIEKKAAELDTLKRKMEQLKLAARAKELQGRLKAESVTRLVEFVPQGATIRIEISGLNVNAAELKKLAEALEKTLPGKERKVIILNPARYKYLTEVRTGEKPTVRTITVAPRTVYGEPQRVTTAPGAKGVDSLEKKLDTLLRELEALRKEIRGRSAGPTEGAEQPRKK
jgi:bla regulator protein BlaR1